MWMRRYLPFALFCSVCLIMVSCSKDTPTEAERDNPFDAVNEQTGGDPFELTATIAGGGIQLEWTAVSNPEPDGYIIFKKMDDETFFQVSTTEGTTWMDRNIQNGHRYQYYVLARLGNHTSDPTNTATVSIDTEPMIVIESDTTQYTATRDVSLTLLAFGAEKMRLANTEAFEGSDWTDYNSSPDWQLATGGGVKRVYLQVIYESGDTSAVSTDTIEPAELNPALSILPDDSLFINHPDVQLSMPNAGALQMKISNVADSSSVSWHGYASLYDWTLLDGDGEKVVYAWFRHDFYASEMATDTIRLDTQVGVASFEWSSPASDTLFWGDEITFTLVTETDAFGVERGGTAVVTVEGWDPIPLNDNGDGSYGLTYTTSPSDHLADNGAVICTFMDRAGNAAGEVQATEFLTFIGPGFEQEFSLGNTGETISMVWIPPGSFMMGAQDDEIDADSDEYPRHEVVLTEGFWMGKYEVTQAQWEAVAGYENFYWPGNPDRPAESVSWNDINDDFVRVINFAPPNGNPWRLPTEAEWEYACRAGVDDEWFWWGSSYDNLGEYAWYDDNSIGHTHDVGQKTPNPWGLYDMHGNVREWCQDRYDSGYYETSPREDPQGPATGWPRVLRGASWWAPDRWCRSAKRGMIDSGDNRHGFRVVFQSASSP
ncbi:SUMF1/EgtB/PvdO family nonheme iron enzyme [bacterium]|nr:SUMF1/EgtB/PvdO family nonheme iron enzyme [bacterium]